MYVLGKHIRMTNIKKNVQSYMFEITQNIALTSGPMVDRHG